jgi:site-specific DNA recombinase
LNQNQAIKNVAIYNRISRDNNETNDVFLNHRTATTNLCKSRGYNYKIYEEIESGSKYEERTELLRLLNDIEEGLYDALVVFELSRIARNALYSQMVAEALENNDVPIVTPSRTYYLDDDGDRLNYDIETAMNSREYRGIVSRFKANKIIRAERGEWIQGVPPLGYTRNKVTRKLEIIKAEAEIVEYIFNLAEKGYGIASIVKELSMYKTRDGNSFNISSVNKILSNTTYTGTISYKVKKNKKKIIRVVECYDAHEPIIPLDKFNTVQKAIKGRFSGDMETRIRSKGECISIFKDLLFCGNCGLKMGIKRDSKNKGNIYVNKCKCGNKGIAENKLLKDFWEELSLLEKQFTVSLEKALETPTSISKESLIIAIEEIDKKIDLINKKFPKLREAYLEGVFSREEYNSDKSTLEQEISLLEDNKAELTRQLKRFDTEAKSNEYRTKLKWLEDVRKLADRYKGNFYIEGKELRNTAIPKIKKENLSEVNRILKLVLDKVYYHRYNEETILYEDGYVDTEKGDFIRVSIKPK